MAHRSRFKLSHWFIAVALIAIAGSSCATGSKQEMLREFSMTENTPLEGSGSGANDLPDAKPPKGMIAPGYGIRIRNLDDRALNGVFRVQFDGELNLPYKVSVQAAGKTLDELKAEVQKAYRKYFQSSARVDVEIADRQYYVETRGLVQKPGRHLIKEDTSLDEVIAISGGFSTGERARYLKLVRSGHVALVNLQDYYNTGNPARLTSWRGGETLFFQRQDASEVSESLKSEGNIQILGEVQKPGEVSFRRGADIFFYLAEAGGPTKDVDWKKVQIVRGPNGDRKIYEFDMDDVKSIPPLKNGDVVVFHSDNNPFLQRAISVASSVATIIGTVALLILAL